MCVCVCIHQCMYSCVGDVKCMCVYVLKGDMGIKENAIGDVDTLQRLRKTNT